MRDQTDRGYGEVSGAAMAAFFGIDVLRGVGDTNEPKACTCHLCVSGCEAMDALSSRGSSTEMEGGRCCARSTSLEGRVGATGSCVSVDVSTSSYMNGFG